MDSKVFFLLVAFLQLKVSHSHKAFVSGVILEDVTFIHETFPVPPSKRAIIEVNVSYPIQFVRQQGGYPIMRIYTSRDSADVRKNCLEFHQIPMFGNGNFDTTIITNQKCRYRSCEEDMLHYTRSITIPYFQPNNFSFSFGFYCSNINPRSSVKGLIYSIVMRGTNETECLKLPAKNPCYRYVQYALFPNLMGVSPIQIDDSLGLFYSFKHSRKCYKHMYELACYIFFPKCDPVSEQTILPCKEMCNDANNACRLFEWIDCDDLPSSGGNVLCTYERVFCDSPPFVNNAVILSSSFEHFLHATVEYSCNKEYRMEGSKYITCTYRGEWSTPPRCLFIKPRPNHLFIVLPILLLLLGIVLAVFGMRCQIKLSKERKTALTKEKVQQDSNLLELKKIDEPLFPLQREHDSVFVDPVSSSKRNRVFDAFVLYHFDTDDNFVINKPLHELEENKNFKLYIHSRNFTPGRDIKNNIEEGIEASNSAIIVMSQGFVDSIWCKEEFTHCYIENMKDESFNLFVIMMQPADTLINISPYMKTFFANKTYLQLKDPELFSKLATHLESARQTQNDKDNNDNFEVHSDDDDDDDDFKLFWTTLSKL